MTMIRKVDGLGSRVRVRPHTVAGSPSTVTVVVSCFNYGRFLPQAVESALTQEGVDVDVIIVDDASTDDSLEIARALQRADERVTVLAHPHNQGVVETFNDGAQRAKGEFVVRLDADDILVPGSLDRSIQVGRAYPSVGLIYGHPLHFDGTTLPSPRSNVTGWTIWPGLEWLTDRCRSGTNVITSPEVVMRRSVLSEVGPQAPLRHTHDMEYWLRFAAFADVAYVHGADQAWHREHSDSLSARQVDPLVDMHGRIAAFEALFAGPAGSRRQVRRLAPVATSTLAREAISAAQHELDIGLPEPRLLGEYLEIASMLDDTVQLSPRWARLRQVQSEITSARPQVLGALARRILGRIRSDISWHRWHRNGVY
jgi:hypothetical protein